MRATPKELIIEHYADHGEDIIFANGYDSAIIGIDPATFRVIYSRNKTIESFVEDGWDVEEAVEFCEYNVFSAWIGEKTPIWVEDFKWQ